mgnify:CR=1 FL=1
MKRVARAADIGARQACETGIDLDAEATVPEIEASELESIARSTKENCPVGKAFAAVPITLLLNWKPEVVR